MTAISVGRNVFGGPCRTVAANGNNQGARLLGRPAQGLRRGRHCVTIAAARRDHVTPDPSATFLITLGTSLAALPAIAASATATAVEKAPSSLPSVPPPTSAILSPPIPAGSLPVPAEAVDSAVKQINDVVKAAGGSVKSGLGVAAQGAGYVKEAADLATPYVKRGADFVAPVAKAAAGIASEVAKPIARAAGPLFQSGVTEVEQFLTKQGLNPGAIVESTKGVTSKAEEAINYATPTVRSTATELSNKSPQLLAEYALGLVALYYLGPPVLKRVFGGLRGYAGQISAASALDAVSNDGDALLVDIRTASEKEYAGIPDLPNRGRLIELEYATVADRKIRNQLRNVSAIEKQMTVVQIASLKKVRKRSRLLLLDKNGGVAKDIAKALSKRGYKRVFVVTGGFSSWVASKLQTRGSSSVSAVEVLSPIFGTKTTSNRSDRPGKTTRYLPSGR